MEEIPYLVVCWPSCMKMFYPLFLQFLMIGCAVNHTSIQWILSVLSNVNQTYVPDAADSDCVRYETNNL